MLYIMLLIGWIDDLESILRVRFGRIHAFGSEGLLYAKDVSQQLLQEFFALISLYVVNTPGDECIKAALN
ncbi:MAG: hypothetical protein DI535_22850 [Citrobacter freundii]|nr:MAG: hypothetical protein DI535_22850 [Citrobacter freundii]